MSYLSNCAPQVTQQDLWNWVRPDVPFPTYNDYPPNPVNGQFFKHTGLTPNQFFQYKAGTGWANLGPVGSFQVPLVPTGQSPLQIHDTEHEALNNNGSEASLFLVYINEGDPQVDGPLLMVDRGFIVKKDLMVGGFVNSGQGALWLNYGLVGKPNLASAPVIQLMSSAHPYPSGTQFPDPSPGWYEDGQLFHLTSEYYWSYTSKTYPAGNYRWEGGQTGDWIKGDLYTGNYDTLYLCKDNLLEPAHLDLGNLTIHGTTVAGSVTCDDISLNRHKWLSLTSDDGSGTTRLFSFTAGELHVQALIDGNWDLGILYAGGVRTPWINSSETNGVIGILAPLSFGASGTGTAGQVLTSNGSSLPTWQTPAWNGGIVNGIVEIAYNTYHDTASYADFGVTRAADDVNNSYIGLTKQGIIPWGIGIGNNASGHSLIFGMAYSNPLRTIPTPAMALTADGHP